VTKEEGQALADEYSLKMQFFETSAKEGTGVGAVRSRADGTRARVQLIAQTPVCLSCMRLPFAACMQAFVAIAREAKNRLDPGDAPKKVSLRLKRGAAACSLNACPAHSLHFHTCPAPPILMGPLQDPELLQPAIIRNLGDRSHDKRKSAALDIENLVKQLQEDGRESDRIRGIIAILGKDFACSTNADHRKGGLTGLAASAIGLAHETQTYLVYIIHPVLHCFDDPESRVRWYACESLYNIAKVARGGILFYFNQVRFFSTHRVQTSISWACMPYCLPCDALAVYAMARPPTVSARALLGRSSTGSASLPPI
jgi:hypothetical protein